MRIYVDTSVLGGCFDPEFKEWSEKLIGEFVSGLKKAVISDLTLREIEEAPEEIKEIERKIPEPNKEYVILDKEAEKLANLYIKEKVVSKKYIVDAQHIAIATINKVDVLVSWNFKHIVNLSKIRLYNAVNLKYGYNILEIRTPREVVDER